MEAHQEILVVVADGTGFPEAMRRWRGLATVTQLLPPRLALVIPDGEPPQVPGTRWYLDDIPADLGLTPTERIFVAAWRARRIAKVRSGDGLSWDTPGFLPPDAPGGDTAGGVDR